MPILLITIYLFIGVGAAVFVFVGRLRVAGRPGAPAAMSMIVLWPFFLPTLFAPEPVEVPARRRTPEEPRSDRMQALFVRLQDATRDRVERPMLEAFLERLRRAERSLAEMDEALGGAPNSVREKLEGLRLRSAEKLEHDVGLLEEVIAHLTVLRFAELSEVEGGEVDESRVRGLLAQIKALVELNAEVGL